MWYNHAVIYQIYPLGLLGAEEYNNVSEPISRLPKLKDWIPHLKRLNVNTILFNPLFESDKHGYDTRDMRHLDRRLGTDEDLSETCQAFREAGFRLMFDGVFNHVGRGFWAFRDVLEKKWDSPYKDWFYINFDGSNPFNDGFSYEGWEGHLNLVKLNLDHPEVQRYIFDSIREWKARYGISGLRLDVAYTLNPNFLKQLRRFCEDLDPEFFLLGEMIHGDYKRIMNPEMCMSATNYECAKGLLSAFNSRNLFEIAHSLQRQFNHEPWALYHGTMTLLSFADNHDIDRAASVIRDPKYLPLVYTLLFTQPGIPAVYYGSEWGAPGRRSGGSDRPVRPAFDEAKWNGLSEHIARLAEIRQNSEALAYGEYRTVHLNNQQFIFERRSPSERLLTAINMDDKPVTVHFDAGCGTAVDLLSGETHDFGGGSELPPCSSQIWKMEK